MFKGDEIDNTNERSRSESSSWYVRASSDLGLCLSTMRAIGVVYLVVLEWF